MISISIYIRYLSIYRTPLMQKEHVHCIENQRIAPLFHINCISYLYICYLIENGGWGAWGPYQDCSATCGSPTKIRSRRCDDPEPRGNGSFCMLTKPIGKQIYDLVEPETAPCEGLPLCPSKNHIILHGVMVKVLKTSTLL